jgi:hypothetical protein
MRYGRERVGLYTTDFPSKRMSYWNPFVGSKLTVQTSAATNVTAANTINTLGSWTQLISSTTGPGDILRLTCDVDVSAANSANLIEIGFGGSGSEVVVVPGFANGGWNGGTIEIPLKIPQGTRISARIRAAVASRVNSVTVGVVDAGSYAFAPESVDVYGTSTSGSIGTAMTANAVTVITASTSRPYQALIASISTNDAAMATTSGNFYGLGTGASNSEVFHTYNTFSTTSAEQLNYPNGFRDIQQGSAYLCIGQEAFPTGTRIVMVQTNTLDVMHGCVIGVPLP